MKAQTGSGVLAVAGVIGVAMPPLGIVLAIGATLGPILWTMALVSPHSGSECSPMHSSCPPPSPASSSRSPPS
jgi:hypothetical protein